MIFRNLQLFFFCTLLVVHVGYGQETCTETLSRAEDDFERGRLYEIPNRLKDCMESGFTREEKVRAYRLLTISYLYLNYVEKADTTYLALLKLAPLYRGNLEADPSEILNHEKKFTTRPNMLLAFKFGPNLTRPWVIREYSMSGSGSDKNYKSITGMQFGAGTEFYLAPRTYLNTELFFKRVSFQVTDFQWDYYRTQMNQVRVSAELPLSVKYLLGGRKLIPYVQAGVAPEILLNSSSEEIQGTFLNVEENQQPISPRALISNDSKRTAFNYSLMAGAGVQLRVGVNYLLLEARYQVGMLNVVNKKARYQTLTEGDRSLLFYPSAYVDDDHRISNLMFNLGFIRPLYKPRKVIF
jgi:hypothetical protein